VVSREHRPYARFYYAEFIRDYPHIYEDDAAFAAWLRMLTAAESMWPARPELPRTVRTRVLAKLTAAGLIQTNGRTYSVKGMDAERNARSNAARTAARSRWGNADVMPNRTEPSNGRSTKGQRDGTPVDTRAPGPVDPVRA
jgi:hypothetical protein